MMQRIKQKSLIFVLVGNKCDQLHDRKVSTEEGIALARQFHCQFLETSAKTAQNVERLFADLVRVLRRPHVLEAHLPSRFEETRRGCCVIL